MTTEEITVYCNANLFGLVEPTAKSRPFDGDHHVARFDRAALLTVDEGRIKAAAAWWREIGRANVDVQWRPGPTLARIGLLAYLCETGASTGRNVAACIGETASNAGLTPIDMAGQVSHAHARYLARQERREAMAGGTPRR
jgi:hypothetical protein